MWWFSFCSRPSKGSWSHITNTRNMKSKSSHVEQRRRKNHKRDPIVRSNPFELRINRQKFSILGRKSKNDKGLPGLSRNKAIKKRKATLLQEYKQGNKVSNFVDKRFGEYDNDMSLEERMLKRFTLEKQKHHESKKLYNLDDDEELTHYGQSLGEMTNFDDADLQLTDEENDEDRTEEDNFGGFLKKVDRSQVDSEAEKQKSKKEIMEDIVAKSKLKKLERQQAKEEAFQLTQDLDSDWKMIQSLLEKQDQGEAEKIKADDYDILVNELKFDFKATPKERMKTEEEIARAEKEKLEKLEAARLERMRANETNRSLHHSADYLGDSHVVKEDKRLELSYKDGKAVLPEGIFGDGNDTSIGRHDRSRGVATEVNEADDDDDDDDDFDFDNDEDESNDEDDDEDDDVDDDVDDDDDDDDDDGMEQYDNQQGGHRRCDGANYGDGDASKDHLDAKSRRVSDADKKQTESGTELPFTFPAPNNLEEFLTIVSNWPDKDRLCIIERIRKCHPAKLEEKNRKKMETFFDVLLKYIYHLCEEDPIPFSFINQLARPVFEIVKDCPHYCACQVQSQIKRNFNKFWVQSQKAGGKCPMPGVKEVILLNLIAKIFPTSDLNHGITTPALIYTAAILSKAYFNSKADLISGLFLANIILEFVLLPKRFVPEAINFIIGIISLATKPETNVKYKPTIRVMSKNRHCLYVTEKIKKTEEKICLVDLESGKRVNLQNLEPETRIAILRTGIHLAKKFAELYKDLPSFAEIFNDAKQLIDNIPCNHYPKAVQKDLSELGGLLGDVEERQPLTLLARKPVPLPLLEPKFDESYEIKSKKRLKDKAANERNKLKYKVKSELKGAIREIRKDSQFLAKEKLDERIKRDNERILKTKEIERQLGNQQGELKALNRMKKKKR